MLFFFMRPKHFTFTTLLIHSTFTLMAVSYMCSHCCPGPDWRKCVAANLPLRPPANIHSLCYVMLTVIYLEFLN